MNQGLDEERVLRTRFLCVSWHAADRQLKAGVDQQHVGEAVGLDGPDIRRTTSYLEGEALIRPVSKRGTIWLLHEGHVAAEESMDRSSREFGLAVAVEGQLVKGLRLREIQARLTYEQLEPRVRLWEAANRDILDADPTLRKLYTGTRAYDDLPDCIHKATTELRMVQQQLAREELPSIGV